MFVSGPGARAAPLCHYFMYYHKREVVVIDNDD